MRDHRAIENALHWQIDVSLREDAARNRKDIGPANIAVLRRRVLDLARRDPFKSSLHQVEAHRMEPRVSFEPSDPVIRSVKPNAMALLSHTRHRKAVN